MDTKFKTSYADKPMTPLFQECDNLLDGKVDDKCFRWSFSGVPHMLAEVNGTTYSLCFFEKHISSKLGVNQFWRVFFPYGEYPFNREDFKTLGEATSFVISAGRSSN